MIIETASMKEMICKIESNSDLSGNRFFEKILYSVDEQELSASGFSEFETYGNYIACTHPDRIQLIKRHALRIGSYICGYNPSKSQLDWISSYYDIISIENKSKNLKNKLWATWFSYFFKVGLVRNLVSPKVAAKMGIRLMSVQNRLRGRSNSVDYDID